MFPPTEAIVNNSHIMDRLMSQTVGLAGITVSMDEVPVRQEWYPDRQPHKHYRS